MANAYFGDHPGRLEIPGECLNNPCLTRTPRLSRDIIVSKYNEKQECGATETSKTVASANVPCLPHFLEYGPDHFSCKTEIERLRCILDFYGFKSGSEMEGWVYYYESHQENDHVIIKITI